MSRSDELIQGGWGADEAAQETNPIIGGYWGGPPPVADTPGMRPWSQSQMGMAQLTAYETGAEFGPMNNPDVIPHLQAQMAAAGFLNPDNVSFGIWDDASVTGYRNVLELANRYGVSAQQALAMMIQNPTAKMGRAGGGGGGGAVRRIRLTNANDLQAVANEVAPRTIGRRLTDDELRKFVNAYHSAEKGESAGDPSVTTKNTTREASPTEASARDLVDVYQGFLKMIAGGS